MRRRTVLIGLGCLALALFPALGAERTQPWIEIAGERAVLARHCRSADGRSALAWTVSKAEAVDWPLLESDSTAFYEKHEVKEIWAVDLAQGKKLAVLGGAGSYLRPGSHRTLSVAWGPVENGRRFAVAAYDWKWGTDTLLLLDVGQEGCTQAPIGPVAEEAVVAHLKRTKRRQDGPFDTQYLLTGLPELGKKIGFSDPATLQLPFSSKNRQLDAPAGSGVIALKLVRGGAAPSASVLKITPGTLTDDSFTDATHLAKADKELNAVYTTLRKQFGAVAQEKLRTEQRAWIEDREQKADRAVREESDAESPRIIRDRTLWKLTEERTAELRQRLKKGK